MRRLLFWSAAGLLALPGCSSAPIDRSADAAATSGAAVVTRGGASQWVLSGVVLGVQPIEMAAEGGSEPGMRLDIILDDGRSLLVEQRVSQAGDLVVGNRVRVLQIGGYARVTYWPYPARR